MKLYTETLRTKTRKTFSCWNVEDLGRVEIIDTLTHKGSSVIYIPDKVKTMDHVSNKSIDFIWDTRSIISFLVDRGINTCKVFVVTDSVFASETTTAVAHGALHGLARIIASEHSDLWGGLIDCDTLDSVPLLALKYVRGHDVVRFIDGVPRRALLRHLRRDQRHGLKSPKTLLPKPEGTYIVTGGFGALGLQTCEFLIENGARRIVLLSRSGLPPRRQWRTLAANDAKLSAVIQQIETFEKAGASIHPLALDISAVDASQKLQIMIDALGLPDILGVVHAAGVVELSLLLATPRDSFERVLAPKIKGSLTLHDTFPPGTLDFFVLYSSIGQLVGTAGQAAYGSGNAFLDVLGSYRRALGDNSFTFQWTVWQGLGMGSYTPSIDLELRRKGITYISGSDAFRAWKHAEKYDIESAVVTPCVAIEAEDSVSIPLLEDVVVRKPRSDQTSVASGSSTERTINGERGVSRPSSPEHLRKWLKTRICECIASELMISDVGDIDPRVPVANLGVDSVVYLALRQKLQAVMKVKVPLTLTWNHVTVDYLVAWFAEKMGA